MDTYRPRTIPRAKLKELSEVEEVVDKQAANVEAAKGLGSSVSMDSSGSSSGANSSGRPDGRVPAQLRPVFMKTGVVSQAAGSAYVEVQNTKVICSVYGPRQSSKLEFSHRGKLWCDFKFAPFALEQRRRRGQDPDERSNSLLLSEAVEVSVQLDKFPKSVIECYINLLDSGGSDLAAAISCVSLAIADAGIECYDLVAACTAARVGDNTVLDYSNEERADEPRWKGGMLLAFMPSLQQVTHVNLTGCVDESVAAEMVELCTDGCGKLYGMMRDTLLSAAKGKRSQQQQQQQQQKMQE